MYYYILLLSRVDVFTRFDIHEISISIKKIWLYNHPSKQAKFNTTKIDLRTLPYFLSINTEKKNLTK